MSELISLAALAIQLVFLAVVLGFVGVAVNKLIESSLESRREKALRIAIARNRVASKERYSHS